MSLIVKTFFRYFWLSLAMAIALAIPGHAHEARPAIVDLVVGQDGRIEVDFRYDFEELIQQFSGEKNLIAGPGRDLKISAKSDAEFAKLNELFNDIEKDFVAAIALRTKDGAVNLALQKVTIPRYVPKGESRIFTARLVGALPAGTKQLTWQSAKQLGRVVVRVKGNDDKGKSKVVFAGIVNAGEVSKPIDVTNLVKLSKLEVFVQYVVVGFEHIIPKGLDHILFVVGLFLLSTRFSSLLWQVSAFTIAHTITLGLAMAGVVSVPAAIVEPLIAASIVYVAIENMMTSQLHRWRPVIVFLFGLLHGLGFASVLVEIGLAPENFLVGLIGFNIGVEVGQLVVIAICFLLVGLCFRNKPWYRSRITIPASAVIAVIAFWWFIERTFL